MLSHARLESLLRSFPRMTVALVGDLFLDRYLELVPGSHELSIETGLEAYQIHRVRNSAGALGTVMNNLAALGVGMLLPVTVIGDDGHGFDLRQCLRSLPVDESHVLRDPRRLTPTYTKPMRLVDGQWRELNRLDVRTREPLDDAATVQLCQHLLAAFRQADAVIVLDQICEANCGVVNESIREFLRELTRREPHKLVFIDSREFLGQFGCGVLKGNRGEVLLAADLAPTPEDDAFVERSLAQLASQTGRVAFCTLGERGILVAEPNQAPTLVPGYRAKGPVDIVGAGDSATSGIVLASLAGASPTEAAAVGNLVASITVQQLGTTGVATPAQLLARHAEATSSESSDP
ncbi:MAG: carbohydrate kinase [Planctomycetales bacterium]|nr:carbohydrate kinase [Planctomycetales bacterium]